MKKIKLLAIAFIILSIFITGCMSTKTPAYTMDEIIDMYKRQGDFIDEFDKKYQGKEVSITGIVSYLVPHNLNRDYSVVGLSGKKIPNDEIIVAVYLVRTNDLGRLGIREGAVITVKEHYSKTTENPGITMMEFSKDGIENDLKSRFARFPNVKNVDCTNYMYDIHGLAIFESRITDRILKKFKGEKIKISGLLPQIGDVCYVEGIECRYVSFIGADREQIVELNAIISRDNLEKIKLLNFNHYVEARKPIDKWPRVVVQGNVSSINKGYVPYGGEFDSKYTKHLVMGNLDMPQSLKLKDIATMELAEDYSKKGLK